jgi:hypothetical protein
MCYRPNVIVSRSHNNEQHGGTVGLWVTRYQRHFRTGKLRMAVSLGKYSTFISIIILQHLTVLFLFYFRVLSFTATDAEPLNLEMQCISAASARICSSVYINQKQNTLIRQIKRYGSSYNLS